MSSRLAVLRASRGWKIFLFCTLAVLLTWLFVQAGEIDAKGNLRYAHAVHNLQHHDEQLNARVVAAYAGLVENYDGIQHHGREINTSLQLLSELPAWVNEEGARRLNGKLATLREVHQRKLRDVDQFQRDHAVVRNSTLYYPAAAEQLLAGAAWSGRQRFADFSRQLLALRLNRRSDQVNMVHLENELRQLQVAADSPQMLPSVLAHAQVLIQRGAKLAWRVDDIIHAPTAVQLDEFSQEYQGVYRQALAQMDYYRRLLYVISLLLGAYALYALLRMERDRRALVVAHDDLAQRYAAQRRAEAQLQLYGQVFTYAGEGMIITDIQGGIIAVNPAFCRITGYPVEEVLGQTPALLNSGRHPPSFYRNMWHMLKEGGHWQGEIWNRRKDGGVYPEWLSIAAVHDSAGALTHYIGVFIDITERKQSEETIHHLAYHDALTGLPNRILLEDRISQGIQQARQNGQQLAVIFIDLDRFKNINDSLGHAVGDELLVQAAQRALNVLRPTDTLSRQGGDEFVAVLPELDDAQEANHLCSKLLASLCQPYRLAGHELTVSGSAGIALFPEDGDSVSELLRKADAAMYRAKDEGRNTFRHFSSEISTATLGELVMENELFGALERNELFLHYQPKVAAQDGRLVGAEALMRWRHREQGVISPLVFIPLAEENGLIGSFGEWALRTVCAQQRAWLDAGYEALPVAVNISAQQFAQSELPDLLADILAQYRLSPHLIELELTESLLMRNAARAASVLERLRAMQIRVAIDDFGTGYSSLSYLHQFPVHTLKIDRSFVRLTDEKNPDDSPSEAARLAAAIIAMAHQLGLEVVAEGVESDAQAAYLQAHACDVLQGYLYGRPQAATEFGQLLRRLSENG